MRFTYFIVLLWILGATLGHVFAFSDTLHFSLEGFERLRGEVHDGFRASPNMRKTTYYLVQRTELGARLQYKWFKTTLVVQDGRVWQRPLKRGQTNLLEGWCEVNLPLVNGTFSLRLGRQTLQLDDAWLFMARGYGKTGLSHDAFRIGYSNPSIDILCAGMCSEFPFSLDDHRYCYLGLLHVIYTLEKQKFGGMVVADWNGEPMQRKSLYGRYTAGFILNLFPFPFLNFKGEGYYQMGRTYTVNSVLPVNAFSLHTRLYYIATVRIGAGLDWVSGGKQLLAQQNELQRFDRLSGSGHSYFGYMDYFTLSLPTLKGLGLRDYSLWLDAQKILLPFRAEISLHAFQAAPRGFLQHTILGGECDLKCGLTLLQNTLQFEAVYGYFYGTNSLENLALGVRHHGHFGYISALYRPKFEFRFAKGNN
ncbi:MAG: hypothetical protein ACTTKZ_02795 [Bacteroides sp.]